MTTKEVINIIQNLETGIPRSGSIKSYQEGFNDCKDLLIKRLATNDGSAVVSDCTIPDWIITYADSDGSIQKAVISGKDDDEAIANFQRDYHQEWRTIKAIV